MKKLILLCMVLLISTSAYGDDKKDKHDKKEKHKKERKVGAQGPAGAQGIPGVDGVPGPAGVQGIQGLPGNSIVGPPGDIGPEGPPGADGKNGSGFVMKDVNGEPFGTVLGVDLAGIKARSRIQIILDGVPTNFDFYLTPDEGFQGKATIFFTQRNCTGDAFVGPQAFPYNKFRPAFGDMPLVGNNGTARPMFLVVPGTLPTTRTSYSLYDARGRGCLPTSGGRRNSLLVEEIHPDLNTLYPAPHTLELQ